MLTNTKVDALHQGANGAVEAVSLSQVNERRRIAIAGGVILASGGFNRHPRRRAEMLPGADPAWCSGAPGHAGSAQDLALNAGARFGEGTLSNAFWVPVSIRTRADGTEAVWRRCFRTSSWIEASRA